MFSIKWSNGCSIFKTTYNDVFKRLDYCNAAMYTIKHIDDEKHNSNGHTYKIERSAFVSYDTPICYIIHWLDIYTGIDGFNIRVNKDSYNCSSSTIHQFVRFLRYVLGDIITYQEIKYYEKHSPYRNRTYIQDVMPISIFWVDDRELASCIDRDGASWVTYTV